MARDGGLWVVTDVVEKKNYALETKWTVSRARDTAGYNVCKLYVDGKNVAGCNGGGYDMVGTVIGIWIEQFQDRLRKLDQEFYGLTFHDPTYDSGKAVIEGKSIAQREKDGDSLGLERYQEFYRASSKVPTKNHTVGMIDGGCGQECMTRLGHANGLEFERKR